MDNFNWGVRRQSISRLEGTEEAGEVNVLFTIWSSQLFVYKDIWFHGYIFFNLQASLSSAMNSLSDMTPILSKRESRGGVGAEESSDDEMGSVSFQKKYFVYRCHVKKPFFFSCSKYPPEVMKTTVELHHLFQLLLL